MKTVYTVQYLAFTLAELTGSAKAAEFAKHLNEMSGQGWRYEDMHAAGQGVIVIYSRVQ